MKNERSFTPIIKFVRFDDEDIIATSSVAPTRIMTLSGYGNGVGFIGDGKIKLGDTSYLYTSAAIPAKHPVEYSTMLSYIVDYFGLEQGNIRFDSGSISPTLEQLRKSEEYDGYDSLNGDYSTYTYNSDTGYYSFIKNTN